MQKNYNINILTLKFMSLIGNKSSGTIFGSHACRFHISTALSELNAPLKLMHFSSTGPKMFSVGQNFWGQSKDRIAFSDIFTCQTGFFLYCKNIVLGFVLYILN